jgi:putative ABC transport system ATP-binding protein
LIVIKNLVKEYRKNDNIIRALNGITITINTGEYISIMGPSGSGKTTLFNIIGGLDIPDGGSVRIDGLDLGQLQRDEMAWLRCFHLGYIFQTFNLIPTLSALDNVVLPFKLQGVQVHDAVKEATRLLDAVGLGDRLSHLPGELSGGQQQRVAIARAFTGTPKIILADEPTGNLDQVSGKNIINILHNLNREKNVTVITATHDEAMLDVSDRVVNLIDGEMTIS